MQETVSITGRFALGVWKNGNYEDLNPISSRAVKLPELRKEPAISERYLRTVSNPNLALQLRLQVVHQEQWEIEFHVKEESEIDKITLADWLSVVDQYGDTYNAEISEGKINYELADDASKLWIVKVIWFRLPDQSSDMITSYVEKEALLSRYSESELNKIVLTTYKDIDTADGVVSSGQTFTYYTHIEPDRRRLEAEDGYQESSENDNRIIPSRFDDYDTFILKLYLNESDMNQFLLLCRRCFDQQGGSVGNRMEFGANSRYASLDFNSLNPFLYEINPEDSALIDLYEIKVTGFRDIVNFEHYT